MCNLNNFDRALPTMDIFNILYKLHLPLHSVFKMPGYSRYPRPRFHARLDEYLLRWVLFIYHFFLANKWRQLSLQYSTTSDAVREEGKRFFQFKLNLNCSFFLIAKKSCSRRETRERERERDEPPPSILLPATIYHLPCPMRNLEIVNRHRASCFPSLAESREATPADRRYRVNPG